MVTEGKQQLLRVRVVSTGRSGLRELFEFLELHYLYLANSYRDLDIQSNLSGCTFNISALIILKL